MAQKKRKKQRSKKGVRGTEEVDGLLGWRLEGLKACGGPSCGRFDLSWEVKAVIEARGCASYLNLPHFKSWVRARPTPSSLPPTVM